MSKDFPSPLEKKATMYYIKHYIVRKTKYRWAINKIANT